MSVNTSDLQFFIVWEVLITDSISLLVIALFRFYISLSTLKDNFMSTWYERIDYQKVCSYLPQPLLSHSHYIALVAGWGAQIVPELQTHFLGISTWMFHRPSKELHSASSPLLLLLLCIHHLSKWHVHLPEYIKPETWRSIL